MRTTEAIRCRIFQLCYERNISENKMCAICGITQSTIGNMTNGRNKSMTLVTVKRICDGLGMELPDFFDSDLFRNLEQEIY